MGDQTPRCGANSQGAPLGALRLEGLGVWSDWGRRLAEIQRSGVFGDAGFGGVPEELDSERAGKATGSVESEFRTYRSPVAPGAGVRGARWIRGETAERAQEVEGRGAGRGRGRPYGSQ